MWSGYGGRDFAGSVALSTREGRDARGFVAVWSGYRGRDFAGSVALSTREGRDARGFAAWRQAFLVSQKISAISSIFASSSSALPASSSPLVPVAPASLVASLTSWWSWGYFSKWGGLK